MTAASCWPLTCRPVTATCTYRAVDDLDMLERADRVIDAVMAKVVNWEALFLSTDRR